MRLSGLDKSGPTFGSLAGFYPLAYLVKRELAQIFDVFPSFWGDWGTLKFGLQCSHPMIGNFWRVDGFLSARSRQSPFHAPGSAGEPLDSLKLQLNIQILDYLDQLQNNS
jgi:hypothetical protein